MAKDLNGLEKKISDSLKEAKKRKKKAKKKKATRYFEGQQEAFEQVLIELKNFKCDLETDIEDDEKIEAALEENESEELLKRALDKNIIIRKTSYYLYEDFPDGKLHGKKRVLEALEDKNLFEKIKNRTAEN